MGSDYSIDVSDLKMFSGEVFLPLGEPCPHDCKHWGRSVIGHGPDDEHYELVVCDLSEERPENEDGSKNGCGCRSWVNGAWQKARDAGEPNPESLMELDFRVPEDDGLPDAPWRDRQARIEIGDALGVEIYREAIGAPAVDDHGLDEAEQFFAFLCRSGMSAADAKVQAFGPKP